MQQVNHYNRDLYQIRLESYKVRKILCFIHHVLDGQYFIDFIVQLKKKY
jgi:hypothetical protein